MSVLSGVSLKKIHKLSFRTNETVRDTRLSPSSGAPQSGIPLYVLYNVTLADEEQGTGKAEMNHGD